MRNTSNIIKNKYSFSSALRLPWAPKVRQKDIDQFLYESRSKFIGYSFVGDHESLAGLPQPIHEGFQILKRVNIFLHILLLVNNKSNNQKPF